MPPYRAQVVMPYVSGLAEDVAINTWHFASAAPIATAADQIDLAMREFYNAVPPPMVSGGSALAPLADYMSRALNRTAGAGRIKVYDLATPEPRIANERPFTLLPTAFIDDKELPAEVALVGTFYAGLNRPRLRGRIYLGPFNIAATEDGTPSQRSRPTQALRDSLASSLRRLITPSLATVPDIDLAVYGLADGVPVPAPPGIDHPRVARIATAGWVDDAWDTQRRRGQAATVRTSF